MHLDIIPKRETQQSGGNGERGILFGESLIPAKHDTFSTLSTNAEQFVSSMPSLVALVSTTSTAFRISNSY